MEMTKNRSNRKPGFGLGWSKIRKGALKMTKPVGPFITPSFGLARIDAVFRMDLERVKPPTARRERNALTSGTAVLIQVLMVDSYPISINVHQLFFSSQFYI